MSLYQDFEGRRLCNFDLTQTLTSGVLLIVQIVHLGLQIGTYFGINGP